VRFWDASATVPLLAAEPASEKLRELLAADEAMVVWWGNRVECASALRRREREEPANRPVVRRWFERLDALAAEWSEIAPGEAVRTLAERNLAVHPLRAGDAWQLAAALAWLGDAVSHPEFVSLDERLRDAASREGFALLPIDTTAGH
jgi:uncharacterized protein with PIN domain